MQALSAPALLRLKRAVFSRHQHKLRIFHLLADGETRARLVGLSLAVEPLAQCPRGGLRAELEPLPGGLQLQLQGPTRTLVGARLLVDLRKGWRLTNPNLEQLRLLEIDYAELVNCAEDQADWQQRHPLLAQASSEERFLILHRLLEELRERLAIDCDALGLEEFERRRKACFDLEEVWAIRADEQPELARTVLMSPVTAEQRLQRLEGLSLRGAFGRWLKARERWLSVEELHRGLKWKDDLYQEITGHLLAMLTAWGLVKPKEVKVGRRKSEVLQGWRLNSSALRWTLVKAEAALQGSYAERLQRQQERIDGRWRGKSSNWRPMIQA